jgi:hypothetical protein
VRIPKLTFGLGVRQSAGSIASLQMPRGMNSLGSLFVVPHGREPFEGVTNELAQAHLAIRNAEA